MHCLGGFVVTVLYDLARPTADVDVIAITPRSEIESLMSLAGQGSDLHRKHKVYLQLVGVATVPESYEERLIEIFPGGFKRLRLLALDSYDLALSKLERNTQRDRDDVKHLARTVPLDLQSRAVTLDLLLPGCPNPVAAPSDSALAARLSACYGHFSNISHAGALLQ